MGKNATLKDAIIQWIKIVVTYLVLYFIIHIISNKDFRIDLTLVILIAYTIIHFFIFFYQRKK